MPGQLYRGLSWCSKKGTSPANERKGAFESNFNVTDNLLDGPYSLLRYIGLDTIKLVYIWSLAVNYIFVPLAIPVLLAW
jgi:hypothetical protein